MRRGQSLVVWAIREEDKSLTQLTSFNGKNQPTLLIKVCFFYYRDALSFISLFSIVWN